VDVYLTVSAVLKFGISVVLKLYGIETVKYKTYFSRHSYVFQLPCHNMCYDVQNICCIFDCLHSVWFEQNRDAIP